MQDFGVQKGVCASSPFTTFTFANAKSVCGKGFLSKRLVVKTRSVGPFLYLPVCKHSLSTGLLCKICFRQECTQVREHADLLLTFYHILASICNIHVLLGSLVFGVWFLSFEEFPRSAS